jgi:hypothetical protein
MFKWQFRRNYVPDNLSEIVIYKKKEIVITQAIIGQLV